MLTMIVGLLAFGAPPAVCSPIPNRNQKASPPAESECSSLLGIPSKTIVIGDETFEVAADRIILDLEMFSGELKDPGGARNLTSRLLQVDLSNRSDPKTLDRFEVIGLTERYALIRFNSSPTELFESPAGALPEEGLINHHLRPLLQPRILSDFHEPIQSTSAAIGYEYILTNSQFQNVAGDSRTVTKSSSWPLGTINFKEAEDFIRDNISRRESRNLKTVKIAIIDAGIELKHEKIKDLMLGDEAYDFLECDSDPSFGDEDHGTNAAGVIAKLATLAEGSIRIIPLRAVYQNKSISCSTSWTLANAFRYAISRGADVINASIQTRTEYAELNAAVKEASDANIIIATAAGQNYANLDEQNGFPASLELAFQITVTATSKSGEAQEVLQESSNYGQLKVDLAAPGLASTACKCGTECTKLGTSIAAPYVAGLVAVAMHFHPGESTCMIKKRLLASTEKLKDLSDKTCSGGRIDLRKALELTTDEVSKSTVCKIKC